MSLGRIGLAAACMIAACGQHGTGPDAGPTPGVVDASATDASADAPPDAAADAPVDASTDGESDASSGAADGGLPGRTEGCPEGMVLVEGNYCPTPNQLCLEHHKEFDHDQDRKKSKRDSGEDVGPSTVSERCLRYKEPVECLSKERRPMRYCMDRYEYPNEKGELPALLISWTEAKKTCEKAGKRLCTEQEYNFACEGEEMLPYTYGYARNPEICNIDKPYKKRQRKLYTYERCMKHPLCKKELERLDQRVPAGSMPGCVSPFGIFDLNGNINEWVSLPGKKYPDRSGLKGGWWGPVRGRCRPTVGFHKEEDYGYEEGFRCCGDAR